MQLAAWLGDRILRVDDPGRGWPALCRVRTNNGDVPVALHIGRVVLTHRKRDDIERRIQNPGQAHPVQAPDGVVSLIIGLWISPQAQVIVAFDVRRRLDQHTRKSMFVKLSQLQQAAALGWAEATSASDETIYAFTPEMLPVYVEMVRQAVKISAVGISNVLAAAGPTGSEPSIPPAERARRAASVLVRSATFGRPSSKLMTACVRFAAAFDRHLLWIAPERRLVRVHGDLLHAAMVNEACSAFIKGTFPQLRPSASGPGPHEEMFRQRYEFYGGRYAWAEADG